jgi:hypothetical protein
MKNSNEQYEASKESNSAASHADGPAKCEWHGEECASNQDELQGFRAAPETHGTECKSKGTKGD